LVDIQSLPGEPLFFGTQRDVDTNRYCADHLVEDASKHKSLCKISELVLGKTVDKEETISDWCRRPLRQIQLAYAALDAHVLLLIYSSIVERRVIRSSPFIGSELVGLTDEAAILHISNED
jgi:hypothetical protein